VTLWSAIVLASVICLALKVTGYLVPPRLLEAPRPARIAEVFDAANFIQSIFNLTGLAISGLFP
jgi:hypothetical protein